MTQFIGLRYKIDKLLGQGGMGSVYLGFDTETAQPVAIKALKEAVVDLDPMLVERFEREGEALRKLNHPNIVKILDLVKDNDQQYIVMDYVGGGDLQQLIRQQGRLPIDRTLELALDIADALARAHRLNIIHRDIKPANVLLAKDGTPRLTDFGVARMDDRTRMTETGQVVGTYAYLAPEVVEGQDVIDERVDIWAFGVMLYEMLIGERPFGGDNVAALLYSIMSRPHPDLAELRPEIPPALVELINRMLAKDRTLRIESVRQVGAELEMILRRWQAGDRTPSDTNQPSRFATEANVPQGRDDRLTPVVDVLVGNNQELEPPSLAQPLPPAPPTATIPPVAASTNQGRLIIGFVTAILVIIGSMVAVLMSSNTDDPIAESDSCIVTPIDDDQLMVLIMDFEPIADVPQRDIQRFITEDLEAVLVQSYPFSTLQMRNCDQIVTNVEDARAIAQAVGASVIVWGNYTDEFIEVNLNFGSTDNLTYNQFSDELLAKTIDTRIRITDERDIPRQSIAPNVLAILLMLNTADGNVYGVQDNVAFMTSVAPNEVEYVTNTAATHIHQWLVSYVYSDDGSGNVVIALDEERHPYFSSAIDRIRRDNSVYENDFGLAASTAAIQLDEANPMPYLSRSLTYLRIGDMQNALADATTAQRLGYEGWASPLYTFANANFLVEGDFEDALLYYNQIVEVRPDDWYAWNFLAALYYLNGDYEQAEAHYDVAFANTPTADFPYPFSIMIAARNGDLNEARRLTDEKLTQFSDSSLAERLIQGFGAENIFGLFYPAFGDMLLGQYESALVNLEAAIAFDDSFADAYYALGVTHCNLGNYAAAEAAYTTAIEKDPEFILLYMLRSEVRQYQGNVAGALEDANIAESLINNEQWQVAFDAAVAGELNCTNFLQYDPA